MYTEEEERDLDNDWHVSLTSAVQKAFEQILKERMNQRHQSKWKIS